MSLIWAEDRRQPRDHALKDFPHTTQVRNFNMVDSTTQDKDLKSWQCGLQGLPRSQTHISKPTGFSDKLSGPKFTLDLLGSEADIWAWAVIHLWREDTLTPVNQPWQGIAAFTAVLQNILLGTWKTPVFLWFMDPSGIWESNIH